LLIAKADKIFVAGHRGMTGSAIAREFDRVGYKNWFGLTSKELDLTNRDAVFEMFSAEKPDVVVDAAAKVGGIHASDTYPSDFLSQNLQIQVNLIDAANGFDVRRLLFLGSSCIYPKFAPQPIKESDLMTGRLEPTNEGYSIAKIAGLMHVQAMRKQHGRRWISAMPTNLYGPGDNFHLENSHVLAALLKRIHDATVAKQDSVLVWGTGTAMREFLHVDDMARASVMLLESYDDAEPINVGSGEEVTINDLAALIARVVGFEGELLNDTSRPDGTPRKAVDRTKINELGWDAVVKLEDGIRNTYDWFLKNQTSLRIL
jgi:GDP-L-fucose synthase